MLVRHDGPHVTKGDERKLIQFKRKILRNIRISMDHVSTKKPIPTKEEKTMNYRNCTTDQIS